MVMLHVEVLGESQEEVVAGGDLDAALEAACGWLFKVGFSTRYGSLEEGTQEASDQWGQPARVQVTRI